MSDETSFDDRVSGWERRFEDIVCEMVMEKTDSGVPVMFNPNAMIESFIDAVSRLRKARNSDKIILVLGENNLSEVE